MPRINLQTAGGKSICAFLDELTFVGIGKLMLLANYFAPHVYQR